MQVERESMVSCLRTFNARYELDGATWFGNRRGAGCSVGNEDFRIGTSRTAFVLSSSAGREVKSGCKVAARCTIIAYSA